MYCYIQCCGTSAKQVLVYVTAAVNIVPLATSTSSSLFCGQSDKKKKQPQNNPKPDSSSCYRDATGLPLTPETPSVRVRFTTPSPKKLGTVWKMQKRTNQKESFENSIHPVLYRKHMIGCFTL